LFDGDPIQFGAQCADENPDARENVDRDANKEHKEIHALHALLCFQFVLSIFWALILLSQSDDFSQAQKLDQLIEFNQPWEAGKHINVSGFFRVDDGLHD
jgi:hypothetical protein